MTGRGRGAPGVIGRGRGRSDPGRRGQRAARRARGRGTLRSAGADLPFGRRASSLTSCSCACASARGSRSLGRRAGALRLLPLGLEASASARSAAAASASLLRGGVGGGLLGRDFRRGRSDVGRLATASNLAAGVGRLGGGRAGSAATAAVAAPRRRRAGAGGAACRSARTRFSRSQRARTRATWSSVSGLRWLRTERPSDEAVPSPRRRKSRTRQPCRVREACSNHPPMGLPRSPTPPARESLSRAADRRYRRPQRTPDPPRRQARRHSVPR